MKVYHSIQSFPAEKQYVVTQGTFDGVHLGHRKILKNIVDSAKKINIESVLLTFHPHPRKIVFDGGQDIKMLTSIEEKANLIESIGIDHLIISPFTKEFSRTTPFDFIKNILVDRLKVKHFVIGYDHRFGKNREGSIKDLQRGAEIFDYTLQEIEAKEVQESIISSTKIRTALKLGDVALAKNYLGRPYGISGKVIRGLGRGKTFGFPTANLEIQNQEKLIPKNGVYVVNVYWRYAKYQGTMNIGTNPTFDLKKKSIEVHILNFDNNIYQEILDVQFHHFLREERKFNSAEELQKQLKIDSKNAKKKIGSI